MIFPKFYWMQCLLAAALFACLPTPSGAQQGVVGGASRFPYRPEINKRLLRILEGEWREGGRYTVGSDGKGFTVDDNGKIGPGANAPWQAEPPAFARLQAYWSVLAVEYDDFASRYIEFNRQRFAAREFVGTDDKGGRLAYCGKDFHGKDSNAWMWGCQPWSAAFISWAFHTAGFLKSEFPPGIGHWQYVDALIKKYNANPSKALFIPKNNKTYRPAVGDLICQDRSPGAKLAKFEDHALGKGRAMHCDIVFEVRSNEVHAIGGNVGDRVTKMIYTINAGNFLKAHERHVFVTFQNMVGK